MHVIQYTNVATSADIKNGHKFAKICKITDYAKIIPHNITVNYGYS